MQWAKAIRKFGPGFLFAGAAIGVSHLVQSTRAGADFGLGLLWALLLINIVKYPFFEFGPRYAMATGESLLEGYKKLGRPALVAYFIITLATMFTIQTAVTIVTSGIASSLFGGQDTALWSAIITGVCFLILILGRYRFLDTLMKIIIVCLTISTLIAVALAFKNTADVSWAQQIPDTAVGIGFLIAFMGWMPAPLDISIWHSMWTLEKKDHGWYFCGAIPVRFQCGIHRHHSLGNLFLIAWRLGHVWQRSAILFQWRSLCQSIDRNVHRKLRRRNTLYHWNCRPNYYVQHYPNNFGRIAQSYGPDHRTAT